MLVALSDTHADADPSLTPHLRETIAAADVVCHVGDFTTPAVLDAFEVLADEFVAVHGNRDVAGVRQRLPATRTVEALGERIVLAHGHEHDATSLSLLARQEGAAVAIVGHTHRPTIGGRGGVMVVNPGSHADPRGNQPAYACFRGQAGGIRRELRTPTGDLISRR